MANIQPGLEGREPSRLQNPTTITTHHSASLAPHHTALNTPFVCSGGRGVNPAWERVPPYNPAGIPCTQRHNARPQSHAHHGTRYYTATHSTMSAAILRTATHTERNSHTAHDRPSQACAYSKRPTHQSAANVELLPCDCVATPHTASRKPFHHGQHMAIYACVTVISCDADLSRRALYDVTYTRIDLHTTRTTDARQRGHTRSQLAYHHCMFIHTHTHIHKTRTTRQIPDCTSLLEALESPGLRRIKIHSAEN